MLSRRFIIFQIAFISAMGALWLLSRPVQKPLPILGHVADFKLTNNVGKITTMADLREKIWVANFIFTTCGSICPMMTKHMNILHRAFHAFGDVRFVSFTVNPEHDTPEVLNTYARKFQADTTQWFFLTGSREDITHVAINSFKLGDIKEPVFHSSYFALVDRQGRIRGYYDGLEPANIKKISKDLTLLLQE